MVWRRALFRRNLVGISWTGFPQVGMPSHPLETAVEQRQRFDREAAGVAEADVAAGRLIDEADMDEWIDSIGGDHELPLPRAGR